MAAGLAPDVAKNAETLARYVAKNGIKFEHMTKERKAGDPKYSFLSDGGEGREYYLECKRRHGAAGGTTSGTGAGAGAGVANALASLGPEKARELLLQALKVVPKTESESFAGAAARGSEGHGGGGGTDPRVVRDQGVAEVSARSDAGFSRPEATVAAPRPDPTPAASPPKRKPSAGPSAGLLDLGASCLRSRFSRLPHLITLTASLSLSLSLFPIDRTAVKKYLREPWKQGRLSRENFKLICKRCAEKFAGESDPLSDEARRRLRRAVEGYVDKYSKS